MGALLVTVAVLLAVETKSLIIGESTLPEQLAVIGEGTAVGTPMQIDTDHLPPVGRTAPVGPAGRDTSRAVVSGA
jgi:hypothetical protein